MGIGLITLSTDPTGEDAFKAELSGLPVKTYTTRTHYDETDHDAGGFIPIPDWPVVVGTLPPSDLIKVIAFLCTSATIALGNEVLLGHLRTARPGLYYTSPGIAAVALMQRFQFQRIAVLTPYGPTLHNAIARYFSGHGIRVVADYSLAEPLNLITDNDISSVPLSRIRDELEKLKLAAAPLDALFVSCAAFSISRSDLEHLTAALGLPIMTSVNAMAWHCLDLLGEHEFAEQAIVWRRLLNASQ
ncbi:aspartate racemase/maleate isomerase family protein [Rhizobium leguminosarum]|jgi:maleate isomerase